ncbi:RSP_7527 family protein [Acidimangrovimonas pyrenivorans]|uniref:RSP_7527 family protein n=1 Tax=Acidimangrovimonas pyrenivorans TaxID=2030798 RepID=A0ABV7AG14_9RHOB
MNTPETFAEIDLAAIEREARRMRAEAVAGGVRAMIAWVASHTRRGAGLPQNA